MRKLFVLLACLFIFFAANAQEVATQPIFTGTYAGKAPCADCKIIETELELIFGTDTSGEYALRDKYIGRQGTDMKSLVKGEWVRMYDAKVGVLIVLDGDVADKTSYYLYRKDGSLAPLDKDLHKVEASIDCSLTKKEG